MSNRPVLVDIVGLDETIRYLENLPDEIFEEGKKGLRKTVFKIQQRVSERARSGPLQARTGELARSIKVKVSGHDIGSLSASVYSDSPYAAIHEHGGTITAKNAYRGLAGGPFLNIPTSANKTTGGVMRHSPREVFNSGAHIQKINSGKAKYGVFLNGQPMFWLVKSVNIKAQLGMYDTAMSEIPTLLSNLSDAIQRAIES